MDLKLFPHKLSGTIQPPPSKSQAHRLLIGAALAKGESKLEGIQCSQDVMATIRCMRSLGADIREEVGIVRGMEYGSFAQSDSLPRLDCGESGSTLRFLIPIALAVAGGGQFTGAKRLMERPLDPYKRLFQEKGVRWTQSEGVLRVEGRLEPGSYRLEGNVSSQFITGLLFALPLLPGDSELMLTTPLESSGYVEMTIEALRFFGIEVDEISGGWHIPGKQVYHPAVGRVEADYSQAAFYYAAAHMGNAVCVAGMNPVSRQGDRVILQQMEQLMQPGTVTIDVRECPDLVPPLAVMSALRAGECTRLVGAGRLRIKESDRLHTVAEQLNCLGAQITEEQDRLVIFGVPRFLGGIVSGCNDHRIAMMLAMAATRSEGEILLHGADCVRKSYPNFWEDYVALGGAIERMG